MQIDNVHPIFSSPAMRLLRADHGAFIVVFLHKTFKGDGVVSLGHESLKTKLAIYIETLRDVYPGVLAGQLDRYLVDWTDATWLRRSLLADSSEPQYQLTRHGEDAIRIVEQLLSRRNEMVGTEGRLRLVINTLTDLVRGTSANPEERLVYLFDERARIDREIEAIQQGEPIRVYNSAQVREQFQLAVEQLRALQGDFRAVEERFHEIAHDVHKQRTEADCTRGVILGNALDAEDVLRQRDEGVSFYAFVNLLFSDASRSALRETIDSVVRLDDIQDRRAAIERLRSMLPSLLRETDKVLKTTARLTGSLRRLLDEDTLSRRKATAATLQEIQQLAVGLRNNPPIDDSRFETVQTSIGVASAFARPFWTAPQTFEVNQPQQHVIDLTDAAAQGSMLAALHRLDFRRLRENVEQITAGRKETPLAEVIDRFPPKIGTLELVGYLHIAIEDEHYVDRSSTESLTFIDGASDRRVTVRVPSVVFHAKAESALPT